MERKWLNETHTDEQGHIVDVVPDENGDFTMEIVNNRGNRISTFKGKSMLEVSERMAEAQIQANRQLGRLLKPDKGREAPFQPQTQEITPSDRLRYSTDINDPNRIVETVEEIVTKRQGAPPATVGQKLATVDQQEADRYYKAEADAFILEHPEYYPTPQNQQRIWAELQRRGYDLTRNNLAIVFEALSEEDALQMRPQTPQEPLEFPARTNGEEARPVARSSGLRYSDTSAMKPPPVKPKPTVSWADIEKMSRQEYEERLRDPRFRSAVDALPR